MYLFNILLYFIIFYYSYAKNIVLPFKKISIEDFNDTKTINDLISFHIYTNISIGTPPQTVAHFIDLNDYSFYFKKVLLSFNSPKFTKIQKKYENLQNFWYSQKKSTTFKWYDEEEESLAKEVYYFNNLENKTTKIDDLRFNIFINSMTDKVKCGVIGLNYPTISQYDNNGHEDILFFTEIKNRDLISEYYYTPIYEENNNLFDYNGELYLGKIILGESPDKFNPEKFKKEDEIINNGIDRILLINEIKFISKKGNYSEENVNMIFSLTNGFIRGTNPYKKEIDKIFFNDLINKNLCKMEYIEENVYINQYFIYSCNNNKEIENEMKEFPSLIFEIKSKNLTFILTYKDLFKNFQDRIYFMVIFRDEKYHNYMKEWVVMTDIFLRKYLTSFNYDSKTISFYRNQVDEVNSESQIINNNQNIKKEEKNIVVNQNNLKRTIIEILMGIFIVIILYLLYRKYKNSRKIRANELEDSNYAYIPKEKEKSKLIKKELELNKIIN